MKINERAPIIASDEIEIAADASIIWEIMSTIDRWPQWSETTAAHPRSKLRGILFKIKT